MISSEEPLPATGTDAELALTVENCAVVPIGESMGFVNVVADGPAGITDRFTILGERYSADLAQLLSTVCPARRRPDWFRIVGAWSWRRIAAGYNRARCPITHSVVRLGPRPDRAGARDNTDDYRKAL